MMACYGVISERGIGTGRDDGVRSRVASKPVQVASFDSEQHRRASSFFHSSTAFDNLITFLGQCDHIISRGIPCHNLEYSRFDSERPSTRGTTICSSIRPIELRLAKLSDSQAVAEETILIHVHLHRTVCQFRLGATITSPHL